MEAVFAESAVAQKEEREEQAAARKKAREEQQEEKNRRIAQLIVGSALTLFCVNGRSRCHMTHIPLSVSARLCNSSHCLKKAHTYGTKTGMLYIALIRKTY